MREIMGPEGRLRMLHLGLTEYSSADKLRTNYSNPEFVERRHTYRVSDGTTVIVKIMPDGFNVYKGQEVIKVRVDPNNDVDHQPKLFLLDRGYLTPTISK